METRGKRRAKSIANTKMLKIGESEQNSYDSQECQGPTISLSEKVEQICREIRNIEENYQAIDLSEWNLDEIAEQMGSVDTECSVQLTSADDVAESENDCFACDEIYANGAKDIKRRLSTRQVRNIGKSVSKVTAVPQLDYTQIKWLIKFKIAKDLGKIILGKLYSFYHTNFTSRKEMPAALIRKTMFSDDQFKFICGCLKGLFVKKKPISELNYALHVLLPETLIRIVMFVKKVNYKEAQCLMDKHLFDKPMPPKEALE